MEFALIFTCDGEPGEVHIVRTFEEFLAKMGPTLEDYPGQTLADWNQACADGEYHGLGWHLVRVTK